jgi:hypothetical protein
MRKEHMFNSRNSALVQAPEGGHGKKLTVSRCQTERTTYYNIELKYGTKIWYRILAIYYVTFSQLS